VISLADKIREVVTTEQPVYDENGDEAGVELAFLSDEVGNLVTILEAETVDDETKVWAQFQAVWAANGDQMFDWQRKAIAEFCFEVQNWIYAGETPAWASAVPSDDDRAAFAQRLRARFPGMPKAEEYDIAEEFLAVAGDLNKLAEMEDPEIAAVVAWVRHQYTGYDAMRKSSNASADEYGSASNVARDAARKEIGREIAEVIRNWEAA
jgi:hypothetical protein